MAELHFVLGSSVEILVLRYMCVWAQVLGLKQACGHRLGATISSTLTTSIDIA